MKKNFKDISLYTFVGVLTKSFSLLIVPIIAHNLSVEEYGNYTIIISVIALIQSIFLFGFEHSLNYYFNKFKSIVNKKILISTQLLFISLIYILSSITLKLSPYGEIEYINLILFWGYIAILLAYFSTLLKVDMQVYFFTQSQIVQSVTLLIAMYLLVVIYQLRLQGVFYANLISISVSVVFMYFFVKKYLIFNYNINLLKKVLHYGLPLMPAGTIFWASSQLDRYYILYFLDNYWLGIYGFSLSIAMIPLFLKMAFKSAIDPFIMKTFHSSSLKTKFYIKSYFTLSLFIFSFLFLSLSIFANDIVLFIGGTKYLEAIPYIPWLLFIASITTFNQYFIYGLNFKENNKFVLKGLVYMLTINIILTYILIDMFNIYGVILANLIANIFYTIYLYKSSNKLYPIEYNFTINITIIFSVLVIYILDHIFFQENYIFKILSLVIFILFNRGIYKTFKGLLNE